MENGTCVQKENIAVIQTRLDGINSSLVKIEGLSEQVLKTLHDNGGKGIVTRVALNEEKIQRIENAIPSTRWIMGLSAMSATIGAVAGFVMRLLIT